MAMSPTQLSIRHLKENGYLVSVVEKWNPFVKIRQDLFGFIDVLAIRENETLAVQVTSAIVTGKLDNHFLRDAL